jgi:hypothetical protein
MFSKLLIQQPVRSGNSQGFLFSRTAGRAILIVGQKSLQSS